MQFSNVHSTLDRRRSEGNSKLWANDQRNKKVEAKDNGLNVNNLRCPSARLRIVRVFEVFNSSKSGRSYLKSTARVTPSVPVSKGNASG